MSKNKIYWDLRIGLVLVDINSIELTIQSGQTGWMHSAHYMKANIKTEISKDSLISLKINF